MVEYKLILIDNSDIDLLAEFTGINIVTAEEYTRLQAKHKDYPTDFPHYVLDSFDSSLTVDEIAARIFDNIHSRGQIKGKASESKHKLIEGNHFNPYENFQEIFISLVLYKDRVRFYIPSAEEEVGMRTDLDYIVVFYEYLSDSAGLTPKCRGFLSGLRKIYEKITDLHDPQEVDPFDNDKKREYPPLSELLAK